MTPSTDTRGAGPTMATGGGARRGGWAVPGPAGLRRILESRETSQPVAPEIVFETTDVIGDLEIIEVASEGAGGQVVALSPQGPGREGEAQEGDQEKKEPKMGTETGRRPT